MKILFVAYRYSVSVFIGFLVACTSFGGDGSGDTFVRLKVTSDPSSTTIGNALIDPADIEFTVAKVVVSEIELERGVDCSVDDDVASSEVEYEYEGPFVVNLLNQKSVPSLDQVKIEDATYCKFKFKLDKLEDDEIPAGVSGSDAIVENSVYIEGIHDGATPFVITLDEDVEFEMESSQPEGLALTTGATNTIFLVFDLSKLFEGIDDFSTLDVTGGVVYIDQSNNTDAYETIKLNLQVFSKLQKDSDDDDELDDDDDVIADND